MAANEQSQWVEWNLKVRRHRLYPLFLVIAIGAIPLAIALAFGLAPGLGLPDTPAIWLLDAALVAVVLVSHFRILARRQP